MDFEWEKEYRDFRGEVRSFIEEWRTPELLEEYARTTECRAVFLRAYFGEEVEEPCGLCDICRGRPKRPTGFFAPLAAPPKPKPRRRGRRGGRRRGTRGGSGSKSPRRRS